ncbi:MAG: HNH endonuclease family protein [Nocardioides sp.]
MRRLIMGVALLVLLSVVAGPTSASTASTGDSILTLLDRVTVTDSAPYYPGYDRDCDPGGCVFGEEWTDDNDTTYGHNGCNTREDVLLQQMRDIELRWGSECRIYQAKLKDPYTGRKLTWRRDGYRIQIDHVYPLSTAWYAGAWDWTQRKRVRFANDVDRELLAVWGAANQAKENSTPSEWLPPREAYHCAYVLRYLRVALHYGLSVTAADVTTIRDIASRC